MVAQLWSGWRRPASANGSGDAGKRSRAAGKWSSRKRGRRAAMLAVSLLLVSTWCTSSVLFLGVLDLPLHHPQVLMRISLKAFHFITRKAGGGQVYGCDYSSGVWVHTNRRKLLYSGRDCQRWLSPMWACRLHPNRSSFLYETLHWQPHSCSLPPFRPSTFLHRMKNQTIAFIGDSMGRQQFQSLMCLLTEGKDDYDNVLDVGEQFGFQPYVKANKLKNTKTIRPSSWAYRFEKTRTTIIFSWSPTLCHIESLPTDGNDVSISSTTKLDNNNQTLEVAFHVDRPPTFLSSNLDKFDVIILNTGPHWTLNKFKKNGWKPHLDQKPLAVNVTMESINTIFNLTLSRLKNWLDLQKQKGATTATIFYRTSSPHHFFGGEWNSGGRCDNTHYRFMNSLGIRSLFKPSYLDAVESMIGQQNTTIQLLNITLLSQLRDEAHISKYTLKSKNGSQDCLHWCLPGVPDTWNEVLYAQLLQPTSS